MFISRIKRGANRDMLAEMNTTQGPMHINKLVKSQYIMINGRNEAQEDRYCVVTVICSGIVG